MNFQLKLNCNITTGSQKHVVFKLLLLMHDTNNH
jgi:hypothetical protein